MALYRGSHWTTCMETEDIKARLTLWYLAMVGLTVSRLLKVTVSNRSIYWWAVWN